MEHGARVPCHSNVPRLHHLERHDRDMDQVPQFVCEESKPLVLASGVSIDGGLIAFEPVLSDCVRDGVVKASVQHAKVIHAHRRVGFQCQFGDGLTDVAIVVHDLRQSEPLPQKVVPVEHRAAAHLWA